MPKMKTFLFWTFLSILLFSLLRCEEEKEKKTGRLLAETYCGSCHLVPEPGDLTRQLWSTEVLPLMGAFLGVYEGKSRNAYLKSAEESAYLQQVYPSEATIDSADWAAIKRYYVEEAPDRLPLPEADPEIRPLTQFTVKPVVDNLPDRLSPFTTMLTVDIPNDRIYAGGRVGRRGVLRSFNLNHQLLEQRPLNSPPAAILKGNQELLQMGSLTPSDLPTGQLTQLTDTAAKAPLLDSLLRPLALVAIDLNLDGKSEKVVAEYGNMTGRLTAFAPDASESILANTPGAIRLRKADLNKDGQEDLLVLFAQGDERIVLYLAQSGTPTGKTIMRFPPSYGSADLKVVDFDQDGDLDILYVNGDNYDYQPEPKPYHGIRLLENDGALNFTETWFYHLDGAYGVEVDDFDGDGDYDLAAIAYFVPPAKRSIYSFVYLEQTRSLRFRRYGIRKDVNQYFMCMTKADVDQDGDQDLLLGNFAGYLPDGATAQKRLSQDTPTYLFLENQSDGD